MSGANTFTGRVALVAGASRGIGAETALAFARAGALALLWTVSDLYVLGRAAAPPSADS